MDVGQNNLWRYSYLRLLIIQPRKMIWCVGREFCGFFVSKLTNVAVGGVTYKMMKAQMRLCISCFIRTSFT